MFKPNNKSGYTLVELVVVVGIIGILLSLSLASVNVARQRSRDAKRIADLRTIQSALEQHALSDSANPYPPDAASADYCTQFAGANAGIYNNACFGQFLAVTPLDPKGKQYEYHRPACLQLSPTGLVDSSAPMTDDTSCQSPDRFNASYGLHVWLEGSNNLESRNDNSPNDPKSYDLMP